MRSLSGASLMILLGVARLPAQAPPTMREVPMALPADASAEMLVVSADGARSYYRNQAGEIWVYDRRRKSATRLVEGQAWDLSLSPRGDAVAYTKAGEQANEQYVWVLALDPETGLASGPERRLGSSPSDAPSISPDGRSVAFARDDPTGVGQSLVVVPVGGGEERVVAEALPSSLANIRWTPDGSTLYFGVNPPVECVPDWSCLPLAERFRQRAGTIRRVSATGGRVSVVVAAARGMWPGLSPDGTTLAWIDTSSVRRWIVADADGRERGTFVLEQNQAAVGWIGASTVLISSTGQVRRLRAFDLVGRGERLLLETGDPLVEPSWSPDGRSIALVTRSPGPAELRILGADGTERKVLRLPDAWVFGISWSPDGRWLAWTGWAGDTPRASAIEISTARVVTLYASVPEAQLAVRWLPDSRGVLLSETRSRSNDERHLEIRRVGLDGSVTVLRDLTLDSLRTEGGAIDASRALLVGDPPRAFRTISLEDDSVERTIFPAQPGFTAVPAVSTDGAWLALRRNQREANNRQMDRIELLRTDGTGRSTIQLPFFAAPGNALTIGPAGTDLVIAENRRADGDPGLYLVTTATQAVRRLMTYSWRAGPPPEAAFSPDGRTVLSLGSETSPPSVFALDLAPSRRPGNQPPFRAAS